MYIIKISHNIRADTKEQRIIFNNFKLFLYWVTEQLQYINKLLLNPQS